MLLQNDEIKREVLGFLSDTYHSLRDDEGVQNGVTYRYDDNNSVMDAKKAVYCDVIKK